MGSRARNVYCKRFLDLGLGISGGGGGRRNFAATDARNFTQPVYRRLTLARDPEKACPGLDPGWEPVFGKDHVPDLSAGDVFFDEIGVLQAGEFNGETVLDMTDHPALGLADGNHAADNGPQFRRDGDRGARLRQVDDAAGDIIAVRQDQPRHRLTRDKAAVAAVFRQIKDIPVGEPGELGGELVALAQGCLDRHSEAGVEQARDFALEPAKMIDIGDHPFARLAGYRRDHRDAATGVSATEPTADDIALILHTSGSTGRPKRVPLRHYNLAVSSANIRSEE